MPACLAKHCQRNQRGNVATLLATVMVMLMALGLAIQVTGYRIPWRTTQTSPGGGMLTKQPVAPSTTTTLTLPPALPRTPIATVPTESAVVPQVVSSQGSVSQYGSGTAHESTETPTVPSQPATAPVPTTASTAPTESNNNTIVVHRSNYQNATSGNASCSGSCGSVTSGNASNSNSNSTNILIGRG